MIETQPEEDPTMDLDPLARADAEYRREKAAIRCDGGLAWEAKERRVKELGERYARERAELETAATGEATDEKRTA